MKRENNKFYYPICRFNNCDGILQIKINNNFTIDYECDKNEEHKGKNIYFKTFEQYYLKEVDNNKCIKCNSNIEYNDKCKYYCNKCIKFNKNIKDNIDFNECPIHNKITTKYCLDCDKYFCKNCSKEDLNDHADHYITDLANTIPTLSQINGINNKIKRYDELIKSIDDWLKTFIKTLENLKDNILKEKEFISKICLNFNIKFMNYTYYSNFNTLNKYMKSFKNKYLENFYKKCTFFEKTKNILQYFVSENDKNTKIVKKTGLLMDKFYIGQGYVQKINEKYFLVHSSKDKSITLNSYEDEDTFTENISKITFKKKIYSMSVSKEENNIFNIYACLNDEQKINIIICDLNKKILYLSKDKIYEGSYGHFDKCIKISKDYLAILDTYIYIWMKNKKKKNGFSKKQDLNDIKVYDILSLNTNCFVLSSKIGIIFYDAENLIEEKRIRNINCQYGINTLLIFNDYLLVNCSEGIALISIKNKELTQYIEDIDNKFDEKKICANNNIVYVLWENEILREYDEEQEEEESENENDTIVEIIAMKMNNGILETFKEYKNTDREKENLNILCLDGYEPVIWGKQLYTLSDY